MPSRILIRAETEHCQRLIVEGNELKDVAAKALKKLDEMTIKRPGDGATVSVASGEIKVAAEAKYLKEKDGKKWDFVDFPPEKAAGGISFRVTRHPGKSGN